MERVKCTLLVIEDTCADGGCIPKKSNLCCLNCKAISCEYRCDKSNEDANES